MIMNNLEEIVKEFNEQVRFVSEENDSEVLALLEKYAQRANISHITLAMLSNVFQDDQPKEKVVLSEFQSALKKTKEELSAKRYKLELLKKEINDLETTRIKIANKICEIAGHDFTPWEIGEEDTADQIYYYHRTCRACGLVEQEYSYESPYVYIKKNNQ